MSVEAPGLTESPRQSKRILGHRIGDADGPTMILTVGIHGNEPAGVEAGKRVLARLEEQRIPLKGQLAVLAGNLQALRRRQRFIHRDLNRQWTPDVVESLMNGGARPEEIAEHREQIELLDLIRRITASSTGTTYFMDHHTSSAEGAPFVTVGDTLRNRNFALNFPLPLILGLEEQVDGALLEFLNNFGVVTMGVEGGQHDSADSIDRHEAVMWFALITAGLIEAASVHDLEQHRQVLLAASRDIPRIVEVRHRHAIRPDDGFRMEPGYTNFQPVGKGRTVARDIHGPVITPESGLILLPLYQGQGDDGFFVARRVRRNWLRVSAVLRRLRLGALIRFLPGVRRHRSETDALIVDTRVARYYPLEIFHLFGFRKLRREGPRLIVSRRRFDLAPPRQISFG